MHHIFQGIAPLCPETPWGVSQSSKKQNGSTFLKLWDVIIFISCIFVAVTIPLEFGLLSWSPPEMSVCPIRGQHGSYTIYVIAVGNLAIDIIFTIDIILNFLQGFWKIRVHGYKKWYLVEDLRLVRNNYLKTGFLWDIIGQLPFHYLDCFESDVAWGIELLHMLRLVKLLRLYRIREAIHALYRKFPRYRLSITAFELLLTLFLSAHWMGCVYFFVGFDDHGCRHSKQVANQCRRHNENPPAPPISRRYLDTHHGPAPVSWSDRFPRAVRPERPNRGPPGACRRRQIRGAQRRLPGSKNRPGAGPAHNSPAWAPARTPSARRLSARACGSDRGRAAPVSDPAAMPAEGPHPGCCG